MKKVLDCPADIGVGAEKAKVFYIADFVNKKVVY